MFQGLAETGRQFFSGSNSKPGWRRPHRPGRTTTSCLVPLCRTGPFGELRPALGWAGGGHCSLRQHGGGQPCWRGTAAVLARSTNLAEPGSTPAAPKPGRHGGPTPSVSCPAPCLKNDKHIVQCLAPPLGTGPGPSKAAFPRPGHVAVRANVKRLPGAGELTGGAGA